MARKFKGHAPLGEGYVVLGRARADGEWLVYGKIKPGEVWMTVKVAAAQPRERKANFWIGWDGRRFAQHKDVVTMLQHHPELAKAVEDVLLGQGGAVGFDLL